LMEEHGYHVWKVERPASMWAPTLDLYNCMDLVGIHDDIQGVLWIQCCAEDVSPHIHKILEGYTKKKIKDNAVVIQEIPPNPYIKTWLKAGNRFFIWGWRLRKNEGKKASYQLRQVEFILENGVVVHREIPDTSELKNDAH